MCVLLRVPYWPHVGASSIWLLVHGIGTCLLRFFCPSPSGVLFRWCFCCLRDGVVEVRVRVHFSLVLGVQL